jgi:SAM-dependent methyltransferase
VNIPKQSLATVFLEMHRVLQPGGLLLLGFHRGDESHREEELWGLKISMDFLFFQPLEISRYLKTAGFTIEEIVERDPYPDVEFPSHRAYIFARKPSDGGQPVTNSNTG